MIMSILAEKVGNKIILRKKAISVFLSALIVLILDQSLKKIIISDIGRYPLVIINNFLSLTLVYNTGAGFGLLKGMNSLLILFSLIFIIGVLIYYYPKLPSSIYVHLSAGLIVGGAVGNLVDRMIYGYVIDFIDFNFWPAFNMADVAITTGVIILGIYFWRNNNSF